MYSPSPRPARHALRPTQEGFALVVVLWIVALLSVLAMSSAQSTRSETIATRNLLELTQVRTAADAAVIRGIFGLYQDLLQQTSLTSPIRPGSGRPRPWRFQGAAITLTAMAESGKVDLNTGDEQILYGLFRAAGANEQQALHLRDELVDYKDRDDNPRPLGAERRDYLQAGLGNGPANAPFMRIEELLLLPSMTGEVYERLAGAVTVYSRQQGIDPAVAPDLVIRALPWLAPGVVENYLAARRLAWQQGQQPPVAMLGNATPLLRPSLSQVYSIRAEATLGEARFTREAVVYLIGSPDLPFAVLAWRER